MNTNNFLLNEPHSLAPDRGAPGRTSSAVLDEQSFFHSAMPPDSAAACVSLGTIQEISHPLNEAARPAKNFAACKRPNYDLDLLRSTLQNPALTSRDCDHHLLLTYQSAERNPNRQAGASTFLAHLEHQERSLTTATSRDLQQWALTPITIGPAKTTLPSQRSFDGAKALCALAAEVGYIDAQRAKALTALNRPRFTVETLRNTLQNPQLTRQEREYQIHLNFQSSEKDPNRLAGATAFLAYLEGLYSSLAEATASDLRGWALTPISRSTDKGMGMGNLPSAQTFEGAKALCTLAAEVGYIDAQRAQDFAECTRPEFDVAGLREILQSSSLSPQERDHQIHLNYQSMTTNPHLQTGAKALLAFLQSQARSLAQVTKRDLQEWALTPIVMSQGGSRNLPTMRAFVGAKALCALAAKVGHIDAQRAQAIATCPRPEYDFASLQAAIQNPRLTPQERDYHIQLYFQSVEPNANRQAGASGILAYLTGQHKSLPEVSIIDLQQWALTPLGTGITRKGNLPSTQAFYGAKALCALAAEVGHIDSQRAKDLAACRRPRLGLDELRGRLQNPTLTRNERDYHIRLAYQSVEKDHNRQAGASAIFAYLTRQERSLAEATTNDLQRWALTPIEKGKGKGSLPNTQAFEGAKALCALAAEVGHRDARRAKELAEFSRPRFTLDKLRAVLQNPELTPKERESYIRVSYCSTENNANEHAGANGIMAYLQKQSRTLADVTASDVQAWAVTPIAKGKGMGNLPNAHVFEGAKGLCALAAQVGHINAQRAQTIAECTRPQLSVDSLRAMLENPTLSRKELDYRFQLTYQTAEKSPQYHTGAKRIVAYLESKAKSLADVTTSDLRQWALTPITIAPDRTAVPSQRSFDGAKGLCALAAEVGYIDVQQARAIAACTRPVPVVPSASTTYQLSRGKRPAESSYSRPEAPNIRLRRDDHQASA